MRKKRKGFTLVELIVVLLIIGIISVIAVPNINSLRTNLKEKAYNKKIAMIKLSAENYVLDNKNKILEACVSGTDTSCFSCGNDCYRVYVEVNDLITSGSIKDETGDSGCLVSNPKGGCMNDSQVEVKISGKSYTQISSQNVHFSKIKMRATDYIRRLARTNNANPDSSVIIDNGSKNSSCTNTLAYDGTNDNNLRYVGKTPCNFVSFNNELWRAIGVMNSVSKGTGQMQSRVKLVRYNPLGKYSWDTTDNTVNNGYGINDWTQADLMNELNSDYLNTSLTSDTYWYNGQNNVKSGIFNNSKKLNTSAQSLIEDAKWYLGGNSGYNGKARDFYEYEKGVETWSTNHECIDSACPRATEWIGKVALLYPSDYGFAVGGAERGSCLEEQLNRYGGYTTSTCNNYDYIANSSDQWLLSQNTNLSNYSFRITYMNGFDYAINSSALNVHPAVYLKANVYITDGSGSKTDPYILSQ